MSLLSYLQQMSLVLIHEFDENILLAYLFLITNSYIFEVSILNLIQIIFSISNQDLCNCFQFLNGLNDVKQAHVTFYHFFSFFAKILLKENVTCLFRFAICEWIYGSKAHSLKSVYLSTMFMVLSKILHWIDIFQFQYKVKTSYEFSSDYTFVNLVTDVTKHHDYGFVNSPESCENIYYIITAYGKFVDFISKKEVSTIKYLTLSHIFLPVDNHVPEKIPGTTFPFGGLIIFNNLIILR